MRPHPKTPPPRKPPFSASDTSLPNDTTRIAKLTTASTARKAPRKAFYGGGHFDGSPAGRINGVDEAAGVSTKAIAHSDAESDPWDNGDRNALIGMGDILV